MKKKNLITVLERGRDVILLRADDAEGMNINAQ